MTSPNDSKEAYHGQKEAGKEVCQRQIDIAKEILLLQGLLRESKNRS
jgi:hypothetical protein